jgi:hypothetical protein
VVVNVDGHSSSKEDRLQTKFNDIEQQPKQSMRDISQHYSFLQNTVGYHNWLTLPINQSSTTTLQSPKRVQIKLKKKNYLQPKIQNLQYTTTAKTGLLQCIKAVAISAHS